MGERSKTDFVRVCCSLRDILGADHTEALIRARIFLGCRAEEVRGLLESPVDFLPQAFRAAQVRMLPLVGRQVARRARASAPGATSASFAAAAHLERAPLTGLGQYRVAEDGRLYLLTKSEHYHAPLGHGFPGYQLLDRARQAGLVNATHNNTRGHVTRLLEEELIRAANGAGKRGLQGLLASRRPGVLNRVLNLETGSLAAEAAIKLVLARFHRVQPDAPPPEFPDRIPVLLVVGDAEGSLLANYHGTTVIAQMMRGMWGDLHGVLAAGGAFEIRAVPCNDVAALERIFDVCERAPRKIAGFFHEIVLMNYGARVLSREFIVRAYALCRRHDVPAVVDEIQTGLWSPELLMYREYGLRPSVAVVGKGFPGGEYPASRVLFTAALDRLPQFGALVTNGQEELASLACLITMRWARANAEITASVGQYYEDRLRELGARRRRVVASVHGRRHMLGLHFHDLRTAQAFAQRLTRMGLDISVQSSKPGCPPAALTKLPLISGRETVDFVVRRMEQALRGL